MHTKDGEQSDGVELHFEIVRAGIRVILFVFVFGERSQTWPAPSVIYSFYCLFLPSFPIITVTARFEFGL